MFINEYDKKYIHVYQQLNKQKPMYSGNLIALLLYTSYNLYLINSSWTYDNLNEDNLAHIL